MAHTANSALFREIPFHPIFFLPINLLRIKLLPFPMLGKVPVAAIGTIKLSSDLVLHDVLYIPSIYLNLILISSLLKHASYRIIFNNAGFLI